VNSMSWRNTIKKIRAGITSSDAKLVDFVMSDKKTRTVDRLLDDIFDSIRENKKMNMRERKKLGLTYKNRFGANKKSLTQYLTESNNYELVSKKRTMIHGRPVRVSEYKQITVYPFDSWGF